MAVLVLSAGSGCRFVPPSGESVDPVPPRVLLLTVDTLRSDHVGRRIGAEPVTPHLDLLLAESVRFPRAIAPVPRTTPALASLLTGRYPHTTGVRTLVDDLDPRVTPLAEILRQRGWTTWAVVSNHVLVPERDLDRGFDVYDSASDARDAAATNDALFRRLEASPPPTDVPFFLWVHYIDPHVPYLPPPELARAFDPGYEGRYRDSFGSVPGGIGDGAYPSDLPKAVAVYRNPLPERVVEHVRRLYAADVRATDERIGGLIAGLRERCGEDWAIVFTADHGESLGEHDFHWDHGDYVHQPGLEVPLAFRWPDGHRLARSVERRERVSLVDVLPTLLELLAVPTAEWPAGIEGRSLVAAWRDAPLERRPVFAESGRSFYPRLVRRRVGFDVAGRFRAVLDGRHKLVWTPGQTPDLEWELYDLEADPGERRNLASSEPEVRKRLEGELRRWMAVAQTRDARDPDAADLERLRSLGYVD